MRREGYRNDIGQPQVILHDVDGESHEPYESLVVDVPEEFASRVIDLATQRKGDPSHYGNQRRNATFGIRNSFKRFNWIAFSNVDGNCR